MANSGTARTSLLFETTIFAKEYYQDTLVLLLRANHLALVPDLLAEMSLSYFYFSAFLCTYSSFIFLRFVNISSTIGSFTARISFN